MDGLTVRPFYFNLYYGGGKQIVTRRTVLQIECMTSFFMSSGQGTMKVSTSKGVHVCRHVTLTEIYGPFRACLTNETCNKRFGIP